MTPNEYLWNHIQERGLSISDVARMTGLSQPTVSLQLSPKTQTKRGIGAHAAWAYHKGLGLPLENILNRSAET